MMFITDDGEHTLSGTYDFTSGILAFPVVDTLPESPSMGQIVIVPGSSLFATYDGTSWAKRFLYTKDPQQELISFMGLGNVTPSSIEYRLRCSDHLSDVYMRYGTDPTLSTYSFNSGVLSDPTQTNDKVAIDFVNGLSGNTKYYYNIILENLELFEEPYPSFYTAPSDGVDTDFTVVFGGCQSGTPSGTIFTAVSGEEAQLFIHLGDLGYPDTTNFELLRSNYKKQFQLYRTGFFPIIAHRTAFQSGIVGKHAIARVWDDHDFAGNNTHGFTPRKANSLEAWEEYTPHYELQNSGNGIYHNFTWGNAEFFMLDSRYNRWQHSAYATSRFPVGTGTTITADAGTTSGSLVLQSSDSPSSTDDEYNGWYVKVSGTIRRISDYDAGTRTCVLQTAIEDLLPGAEYFLTRHSLLNGTTLTTNNQADWLASGVNDSTARWKVICTPTPFNETIPSSVVDVWITHDIERVEYDYLLQEISGENVILISSDLHRSYIDDGTNSNWPEICAGPLQQSSSTSVGTWSNGAATNDEPGYGVLKFLTSPYHMVSGYVKGSDGNTLDGITPIEISGV